MMKAIQIEAPGGPEALRLIERPHSKPKPGEILIGLQGCGLNYIDVYHRTGLYPVAMPSGLGLEGAGEVLAIGDGVTRFAVGDRAAFCSGPIGAYAQSHCVPERKAVKLPGAISYDTAAAIMLKGLTAEFLIRRMRAIGTGSTILFHAAAGGVGLIACAWAKTLGANVIGTVGSLAKAEIAKANGCDHIILYRSEDVATRVREITAGKGCDVVFDSVGKDTMIGSLDSAARRGLVVSFGNASGPPPAIAPLELAKRGSLFLSRPTLFDYVSTPEELDTASNALFAAVQSGDIKPMIGARYALADAAQAHRDLEARATTGSSLLIP
jgi:NADPH:quinone reductase